MKNKPTGNVTFLFTDIEGSTRLAQEFPESLPAALEMHNAIMHKATESNNGFVYEIVGDAFCCAFEKAEDAVKAAVDAQINLANEKWDDVKIKIRIGIHSGNVEWDRKRYMGYITLARAARVMSAAYGEQIIVSNDAYEIAKEKLLYVPKQEFGNEQARKISFRDLGERRLKDLKQPVRLYQILSEGLREDFPPLKTLDARPNNLPVQLTSFIGREAEMKTVKDLLKQTHLLTLTGSGGAGKTRFALQVGADVIDDFANGVWFVELAALSEPVFLPQAIMKVFELKEEPKKSPEETLCDYLREKEILIILDNCEHLVEACAKLTEKLLSNSPKLKILATSREALRCSGEQTHRILSLEVPDPKDENSPEKLSQYEAVRLFIERALAVDSTFRVNNNNAPALAEICYQLDGIPLAIELAAARTKVLSVEKIYERLNDRFNLLTGGKRTALPRQQTLRALIDWSYDLLSEKEKLLWRRLSVFAGGWTLEAAEEVCSDENIQKKEVLEWLDQLSEKSIIYFEKEKERYGMLETIKQYGEEKFAQGDDYQLFLMNHLEYFVELAQTAYDKFKTNEQSYWTNRFDTENLNIQFALKYSPYKIENENLLKLTLSLGNYWDTIGNFLEGIHWFSNILEHYRKIENYSKAKCNSFIGIYHRRLGEYENSKYAFEKCLSLINEESNKELFAYVLLNMAMLFKDHGEYLKAKEFGLRALKLFKELNSKWEIGISLLDMGTIEICLKNEESAKEYYLESLEIFKALGDKLQIGKVLNNLGTIEQLNKNFEESRKFYEESLIIAEELSNGPDIAVAKYNIGNVMLELKDNSQSYPYFEESLILSRKLGLRKGMVFNLLILADFFYDSGKIHKAIRILASIESSLLSIVFEEHNNFLDKLSKLKNSISKVEFDRIYNEGKAMNVEQSIDHALNKVDD